MYGVDYRTLPLRQAAALASGLGPDSRIGRRLSGRQGETRDILLAILADRLGDVICLMSRGKVHPEPIAPPLLGQSVQAGETVGYESAAAFEAAWREVNGYGD